MAELSDLPEDIQELFKLIAANRIAIQAILILLIRKKVLSIKDACHFLRSASEKTKLPEAQKLLLELATYIEELDPTSPLLN